MTTVSGWRRWVTPSYPDLIFIAMIVWLFMLGEGAWSRLLADGDTGWHIRVGEWILAGNGVPRTDFFSFSKPGEPWYAWEWGAEVIYAWLHGVWGLKGIVILSAIQVALFVAILCRWMIWRGANPLMALAVLMLAAGAASHHYLARPHLFTLCLLPAALWILERDRKSPDRWVWALVPVTIAWTNLHGGFLALIACLGLAVIGDAINRDWTMARRYAAVAAGCGAATLVNPYGWRLHVHVLSYLRSDWIKSVVDEFQSPKFRSENMLQLEALLIAGLMSAVAAASRRHWMHVLWVVFWAHQSLTSVRHGTVFVTVAAPLVATELTRLWRRAADGAAKSSTLGVFDALGRDMVRNFRWTSAWPVAFAAFLFALNYSQWPKDFPELRFPVKMIAKHQEVLYGRRVLTNDEWADYLIYRFYPRQRVYFDGRTDFYGPAVGEEYLSLAGGSHDWDRILERRGFDAAILAPGMGLTSLLKRHPGWRVVDDDGESVVLERTAAKSPTAALMNPPRSAEDPRRGESLPSTAQRSPE